MQGTQCVAGLSFNRIITDYTHDKYCDMHGNSHYIDITLVEVIQTLVYFLECSSISVMDKA